MDQKPLGLERARVGKAGKIKGVRADHVARYQWAAERCQGHVVDAGCNCGYGSAILASYGLAVYAVDVWPGGLAFARQHWDRPNITWAVGDITAMTLPPADAVVCFEVIEHLDDPAAFLRQARVVSPVLLASVPNEDGWPWHPRLAPEHKRHYRRSEFDALLRECGWTDLVWFGQETGYSDVSSDAPSSGRTLVVECH